MSKYVFVPSRGISNLNMNYRVDIPNLFEVFVPSRGISNLNKAKEDKKGN